MNDLPTRYALARSLNFGEREKALRHGPVRPQWSADGLHFWYSTRGQSGVEHVLVDVARRRRHALFDAPALMLALQSAGEQATVESLADLRHDAQAGTVAFTLRGERWCWYEDHQLQRLGRAFADHEVPAPDGRAAVLLDGANLRLRAFASEDTQALTEDGEPDFGWGDFTDCISQVALRLRGAPARPNVLWSPDSSVLAVQRIDRRAVPLAHLVQAVQGKGVRPVLHSYRYPTPMDDTRPQAELWFIGQDGRRVQAQLPALECNGISHFDLGWCRWAPDGRHFDLVDADRARTRLTLWRIDSRDGSARRLLEETGPAVVMPSPTLAEAAIFHVLRDGRVLWWSQRSGWGHLYVVGPDGGARALTQGAWQVRQLLHVDEEAGVVLFSAGGREPGVDPYFAHAYRVQLDGQGLRLLTPDEGHHDFLAEGPGAGPARSVAPGGRHFVDNHSTVTRAPRAVLRDAAGGLVMELQAAPETDTWPQQLPLPEPFTVRSLDAEALDGADELWGVIYKPANFDAAKRYPVLELVYGAPQAAVVPKTWANPRFGVVSEQLAALGFVVVSIDGPGTPYRSRAFQLASHGRLESCGGLRDHANAIRTLAAERPWMDVERVGIMGASGGGYATVRALAEFGELYKTGVAMCGNHDQSSYIAGWGDVYQGLYDPVRYATQDNQSVAQRITGELLLIHGEMDDNVHPAMTLRVVDALIKADRNFEMLTVPDAGHMLILLPYVQRRIWDFLVRTLMGRVPPRPGPAQSSLPP